MDLTTLTAEDVADGVTFAEACQILRKEYDARNRVWASYGDYDRSQFERQCTGFDVPYPFGKTHINVKSLFALTYGLEQEVGMVGALKKLNLVPHGTHHRGVDDAQNIARILANLLTSAKAS